MHHVNDDVLRHILTGVRLGCLRSPSPQKSDLLSASLVCRRWTAPAQAALYHTICLEIGWDRVRDERAACFSRTMRTCPHLLRSIRHLTVEISPSMTESPPPELLKWAGCIPQDVLLVFELNPAKHVLPSGSWQDALFRAPAVRTVRRLKLGNCHHPADTLLSIAAFPQLEELSISVSDCLSDFDDDTTTEPATFPKLRVARLSSILTRGSTSTARFLALAIRAPRLQTLELRYSSSHSHDELIAAFRSMTPTLKAFSIFMAPRHLLIPPFMDEVAPRLSSLNKLTIIGGIFSSALLQHLPRTVIQYHSTSLLPTVACPQGPARLPWSILLARYGCEIL